MAKSSLDSVKHRVPLEIEWRAFELRPGGSLPEPGYRAQIEAGWPRVVQMGRQYGVEMKSHRLGVDTRPAHQALKIVQRIAPERADAFNTAIFRAYFERDEEIGDPDLLTRLAEALEIDGARVREGLAAGEGLEEVIREEREAHASGITGVPALVFLDKYLLSGVRPPEQIEMAIQQIREHEGQA